MQRTAHEHLNSETVSGPATDTLTLPFELRQRSRLLARLDSGVELALMLPRGRVLRGGDRVRGHDGAIIEVRAAAEAVSTVRSSDAQALARVAYHLGNRHVALEVGIDFVRFLRDHVLDDMVRSIGLEVAHEMSPFEPEGGAYGAHAHGAHAHGDAHAHGSHDDAADPR
jgi:urease accessory protein